MNLTGLGATTFLAGLATLLLGLGALHLLRVRMRRQVVDSLLFFRSAALEARPRVLGRRLTRLGSFLLCAALLAAAFTAFAEPRGSDAAPSRIVMVDRTDTARAATTDGRDAAAVFAEEAENIVRSLGLGPRGRVVAMADVPRSVLLPDEPTARLRERLDALPIGGAPADFDLAMVGLAQGLRAGDEIVVIGASAATTPAAIGPIRVTRAATPALTTRAAPPVESSPARRRVFVADDLPPALGLAVDALGLDRVALDSASLAFVRGDAAVPSGVPAVVVEAGSGTADGIRLGGACPAALSLRDRVGRRFPAFHPSDGDAIWVGGARDELAVVTAGTRRVRVVDAFFDEVSHRDVPLLVEAAVNYLIGGRAPDTARAVPARDATARTATTAFGPSDALAPWFLAAALVLLCLDAFLLGRGRVA